MTNRYGFEPHDHKNVMKNVKIFIDRVLGAKGLSESLRMNPELESDLKVYFYESCSHYENNDSEDKSRLLYTFDFEQNPFNFMGRKFEIKDGALIIDEKSRGEENAVLIRTTYSEEKDGHLLKSQQGKRLSPGNNCIVKGYSEKYSYFTQEGVEMSEIAILHSSEILESISEARLQITPDDITQIKITQDGLVLSEEPKDFWRYEVFSRDTEFVERMNCYIKAKEREPNDNERINIFEYKGNLPINTEHAISHLNALPSIDYYFDKRNVETNEITPKVYSVSNNYASYDTTQINGRERLTRTFVNLASFNERTYCSPLEIKRIEGLIELSDGRALEAEQFIVRGNRDNTLPGVFKIYEKKNEREFQNMVR